MQVLGKNLGATRMIRGSPDPYMAFPAQSSHCWNGPETLLGCTREEQQRLSQEQQDPGKKKHVIFEIHLKNIGGGSAGKSKGSQMQPHRM